MPTRRPKVPKASGGDGSSTGGRAGRSASKPARKRNDSPEPDVISATKPVEDMTGTGTRDTGTRGKNSTTSKTRKSPKTPKTAKQGDDAAVPGKAAAAAGRLRRRSRILSEDTGTTAASAESSDDLRPVPAKAFSGRLLVLAMVMLVVTVLLAPSVNTSCTSGAKLQPWKRRLPSRRKPPAPSRPSCSAGRTPTTSSSRPGSGFSWSCRGRPGTWSKVSTG